MQDFSNPCIVNVVDRAQLRVIADRAFRYDGKHKKALEFSNCVDLFDLGSPPEGEWSIAITPNKPDPTELVVERWMGRDRSSSRRQHATYQSFTLPIYVDRGNNCLTMGLNHMDVDNELQKLLRPVQDYSTVEPFVHCNQPQDTRNQKRVLLVLERTKSDIIKSLQKHREPNESRDDLGEFRCPFYLFDTEKWAEHA